MKDNAYIYIWIISYFLIPALEIQLLLIFSVQFMFSKTLCLTPRRRGHNSDVYRSFSLRWIYFYKSIQICFCAAYCTGGVNVLYKVFRSGIRFSPNSISQFSVLSGAFIILTVADKAIIFRRATTKCRQVLLWQCVCLRGGNTNIIPPVTDVTYCLLQSDILCNTKETDVLSICVLMHSSVSSFYTELKLRTAIQCVCC